MQKRVADVNSQLDRVEARLDLLTERTLRTELSTSQIKQNSAERLETINQRFDDLNETIDTNNSRDRWFFSISLGAVIAFGSMVFYLWMEPMEERFERLEDNVIAMLLEHDDRV